MECLMPTCLSAIREIRWQMENGNSVRESIKAFTGQVHNEFADELRSWLQLRQSGETSHMSSTAFQSPQRRALISLLDRGLQGQPILESLKALEEEVLRAAMSELDGHIARLPFLSMIPLFLFQFPAYLLLLLGPLLSDLLKNLGSIQ
jgi:hypothetical protein